MIVFRYVWPSELDLIAQLAGLRLRDRWAGGNRESLPTDSRSHVSIWQKPAPPYVLELKTTPSAF